MIRCTRCLYPNTKPDLHVDSDGVCSACRAYDAALEIDWDQRRKELELIIDGREPNGSGYDCIVASSGGKDSHWQALTLIEMGLKPLLVTASTDYLTSLGRANLDNLARHATTIEVNTNRAERARLCAMGLTQVGDVSWPEHASIFSTPFRVAAALGIDLIFYGESPQAAYGGPLGSAEARRMTKRWITEFGGFLGLRPADVADSGIDMRWYTLPDDAAMERIEAYFLGQFLPWDSRRNATVAKAAGMAQFLPSPANWWHFENVDNLMTSIHDFGMFLKYGYGRATAQLSVDIRHGWIERNDAAVIASQRDGTLWPSYAGVPLSKGLEWLGLSAGGLLSIFKHHANWDIIAEIVPADGGKIRAILRETA